MHLCMCVCIYIYLFLYIYNIYVYIEYLCIDNIQLYRTRFGHDLVTHEERNEHSVSEVDAR